MTQTAATKSEVAQGPKTLATRSSMTQSASARSDPRQAAGNLAIQNLFRNGILQAKLTIGPIGDPYEQQADHVAEQVMSGGGVPSIQRKCGGCDVGAPCSECAEKETIQAKSDHGHAPLPSASAIQLSGLRGGGLPLPASARAFFEPRFGRDFSSVQVHVDNQAAQAAHAIQARAFTAGNEVFFGSGQYAPDTSTGKRLLAHELAHVVQQGESGARIQRDPVPGASDDIEIELMIDQLSDKLWNALPGEGEPLIASIHQLEGMLSPASGYRPPSTSTTPPTTTTPITGGSTTSGTQSRTCTSCHAPTPPAAPQFPNFPTSGGSFGSLSSLDFRNFPAGGSSFGTQSGFPGGQFGVGPWPVPSDRPNIAMDQGIASEKWDEGLEYQYRRRGDERRARMIRDCRENGAVVCAWMMPVAQAWRLFNIVKEEAARRSAERFAAEIRGASQIMVDDWRRQPQSGSSSSSLFSPTSLFAAALPAFAGAAAPAFAPAVAPAPAQLRPQPRPTPVPVPQPTPTPSPGPGLAPGEGTLIALLVYMAIHAIIELKEFANFQGALEKLGYVVLEDPLGLCIGGCHLPQISPSPWPEPLPGPRPWPKPKPEKKRRRPTVRLYLPPGKYRHAGLYAGLIAARQLGSDPGYDRPYTSQAERWRREMDPERGGIMVGSMFSLGMRRIGQSMGCDPETDRICRQLVKRRVLLPDWNRAGGPHLYDTDHVIELQVGALLPLEVLDAIWNYELLDFSVNRSIGPQLARNILYERARLTALYPYIPWFDILLVFEELVLAGQLPAEYWTAREVELGAHIEAFPW